MAKNNHKIEDLTPEQIRERGRQLLRLAQQKEIEIKNRQFIKIGEIFLREIQSNWPSSWPQLAAELEPIVGQIPSPAWCAALGVRDGGEAPMADFAGGQKE